jgi:hypothetical protein
VNFAEDLKVTVRVRIQRPKQADGRKAEVAGNVDYRADD